MKELSTAQAKLYEAIARLTLALGKPPTMQELADDLGNTPPTVYYGILRLEAKGLVRKGERKIRSVEIVKSNQREE